MAEPSSPQHASNGFTFPPHRTPKTYNIDTNPTSDTAQRSQEAQTDSEDASITSPASISSPPYWVQSHSRSISNISVDSMMGGGITLLDNTEEEDSKGAPSPCWAKHVYIADHTVINGSRTGIGAFVVWNITIETLHGSPIHLRKRYSEFDDLKEKLLQTFPRSTLPDLPRKSLTAKFRPKFLEERREGLQYFLNSVLLNPEFSASPVLKEFVFN